MNLNFDSVSPDLQEKLKACKTSEELLEIARSEGQELTDDQLSKVAGGWDDDDKISCYSHGCTDFTCQDLECRDHGCLRATCVSYRECKTLQQTY